MPPPLPLLLVLAVSRRKVAVICTVVTASLCNLAACTNRIIPPLAPPNPRAVFVLDHGRHATLVLPVAARQSQAQQPQTWQEAQNFRSGPTPFEPLMKFWYELDAMSDNVSIMPLTKTLLDREFTLVTIANHPVTTPHGSGAWTARRTATTPSRPWISRSRMARARPPRRL